MSKIRNAAAWNFRLTALKITLRNTFFVVMVTLQPGPHSADPALRVKP
jgi:hypothetical protein